MNLKDTIARIFGRRDARTGAMVQPKPLPRQAVEHDDIDKMRFGNYADQSPRFHRATVEEAPQIAPDLQEPDPIDFASATPEEIKDWQEKVREVREKREQVQPYDAWENLTRDMFYAFHHHHEPDVLEPGAVDPGVAAHAKIMQAFTTNEDFARSRNVTRDDAVASGCAVLAGVRRMKEALEDELVEQARQSEEFEQQRDKAEGAMERLESLREQARQQIDQGVKPGPELVEQIKQAVADKRGAQNAAAQIAQASPVPLDHAAYEAIQQAAQEAAQAAEDAGNIPTFGQGFGRGEPVYESPEQALAIAEMWANNEELRAIAQLYGRMFSDFHFRRAKRVIGGADEIVDIKLGDNLARVVPTELGLLADEDLEDDFYARYSSSELLVYDTVGEETAGRGPIIICGDGSGSMGQGEPSRNTWLRAIGMTLLNTARREKRDFAFIEWASNYSSTEADFKVWLFPTKKAMAAEDIVDMASHWFGGGTNPLVGITAGLKVMSTVPEFKKADLVLVSDGQASFSDEDRRVRDRLTEMGVRTHGISLGGDYGYVREFAGDLAVSIHDFDLADPNEATTQLATRIT
jgi:uncharacterized protein with von Willebrand factor type A (vWA) domain